MAGLIRRSPNGTTEGVPHQDRRFWQGPHKRVVMVDDLADVDVGRRLGVIEFLVECGHARPRGRVYDVARGAVALYPAAPTVR